MRRAVGFFAAERLAAGFFAAVFFAAGFLAAGFFAARLLAAGFFAAGFFAAGLRATGDLERGDAALERAEPVDELAHVVARGRADLLERLAHPVGRRAQLVGDLLRALARELRARALEGLLDGGADLIGALGCLSACA